jgi:hypothetical protein
MRPPILPPDPRRPASDSRFIPLRGRNRMDCCTPQRVAEGLRTWSSPGPTPIHEVATCTALTDVEGSAPGASSMAGRPPPTPAYGCFNVVPPDPRGRHGTDGRRRVGTRREGPRAGGTPAGRAAWLADHHRPQLTAAADLSGSRGCTSPARGAGPLGAGLPDRHDAARSSPPQVEVALPGNEHD